MMDNRSSNQTIWSRVNELPRSTRFVISLLALVCAVLGVHYGMQTQKPGMCCLLGEARIQPHDLQRMQIAFGKAGLNDFAVVDRQIQVPVDQRASYLKVLSEKEVLPSHLKEDADPNASLNPFMSMAQQKIMRQNEKKRMVKDTISRLPFVEQAWFEMDVADSKNAFQPSQQTAIVSVTPIDGQPLDGVQVQTIRQIVQGSLAGIRAEQVVVTDLTAGRAFSGATQQASLPAMTPSEPVSSPVDTREDYFSDRIHDALTSYDGVVVDVNYESESRYPESGQGARFAELPSHLVQKPHFDEIPEELAGANGVVSIEDDLIEDVPVDNSRIEMARNLRPVEVEKVTVSLVVPETVVLSRYGAPQVRTLFGFPLEEVPATYVDDQFERMKSELIEKVRPVLPIASFEDSESYPISVVLERQAASTPIGNMVQLQDWMLQNWPTVSVALVGLLMLIVVTRGKASEPPVPSTDLLSIDSEAIQTAESETAKSETEEQLTRLVEQDPDAAAEVIKSWIRKAA